MTAQGFKGPKELFTGANEALFQLAKQSGKLKKLGVNVFEAKRGKNGERVYRDLRDIVEDISKSPLAKDDKLLIKAFGSKEAAQFLGLLSKNVDKWDELYTASQHVDVLQEDYTKRTTGRAGRLRRAWERMKNSIARAFTPQRIEKFVHLVERLADFVGFLADHAEAVGVAIAAWKLGGPALKFLQLMGEMRAAGGIRAFLSANAGGAAAESAAAGAAAGGGSKAAAGGAAGIFSAVNVVAALATQLKGDQAGPSKKEALANLNALIYSRSQDANLGLNALAEKYQYNIHGKSLKELQAFAPAYQYGGAGGLDQRLRDAACVATRRRRPIARWSAICATPSRRRRPATSPSRSSSTSRATSAPRRRPCAGGRSRPDSNRWRTCAQLSTGRRSRASGSTWPTSARGAATIWCRTRRRAAMAPRSIIAGVASG